MHYFFSQGPVAALCNHRSPTPPWSDSDSRFSFLFLLPVLRSLPVVVFACFLSVLILPEVWSMPKISTCPFPPLQLPPPPVHLHFPPDHSRCDSNSYVSFVTCLPRSCRKQRARHLFLARQELVSMRGSDPFVLFFPRDSLHSFRSLHIKITHPFSTLRLSRAEV